MGDITPEHYNNVQKEIEKFNKKTEELLKNSNKNLFSNTDDIHDTIDCGNQLRGKAQLLKDSLKKGSKKEDKWKNKEAEISQKVNDIHKRFPDIY